MIANYHTHTFRCNHAYGTEREYIENAIKEGFQVLGFSDHVPMPYSGGWYSRIRMKPQLLEDYIYTLQLLKKEYAKEIEILVGFEAEYYPELFYNMMDMLNQYDHDYLILGQHYLGNGPQYPYCGSITTSKGMLKQYVEQCIEGMKTGMFTYFAHPDIIYYAYEDSFYRESMERLCLAALASNVPLELNFLGMEENKCYPRESFFEIVGRVGNPVIFGCDAHEPRHIVDHSMLEKSEKMASKYKLRVIEKADIKKPKGKYCR